MPRLIRVFAGPHAILLVLSRGGSYIDITFRYLYIFCQYLYCMQKNNLVMTICKLKVNSLKSRRFLATTYTMNPRLKMLTFSQDVDRLRIVRDMSTYSFPYQQQYYSVRAKRIWYLSPMRAAKVQASLRIRAVSPEPPLLAHTSSESRGTFRQKARSLALLNGWACAVKICHDGMLEDTDSLDTVHLRSF